MTAERDTTDLYAVQRAAKHRDPLASGKPHPILPAGAASNDDRDARYECARSVTARRDGHFLLAGVRS